MQKQTATWIFLDQNQLSTMQMYLKTTPNSSFKRLSTSTLAEVIKRKAIMLTLVLSSFKFMRCEGFAMQKVNCWDHGIVTSKAASPTPYLRDSSIFCSMMFSDCRSQQLLGQCRVMGNGVQCHSCVSQSLMTRIQWKQLFTYSERW